MMDVGEKGRPPGDPPDTPGLWVAKVKGSSGGGMATPESVLNDEFVRERVSLEFPNGEDGEPVITIDNDVLEAMNGLWKRCMIVKVLGNQIPISVLSRKLRELWKPTGAMYVMDLPRQFFMIRFELDEEYMAALTGGPWRIFGNYLLVQNWSPSFDPLRDEIVTTPVWVRLMNIPVNYYHRSILKEIARGLGKPLKVDVTTLKFERARFARICVEVNLSKPLKGTVLINGERYFVAYEGLTKICSMCGLYGHLVHTCPKGAADREIAVAESNKAKETVVPPREDDGFTVVRRAGRRPSAPAQKMVFVVGTAGRRSEQSLREIPTNQGMEISNRFGGLDQDAGSSEIREVAVLTGANKENEYGSLKTRSDLRAPQVKEGSFNLQIEKGKGGTKNGPKWRRNGGLKIVEPNGPKQKLVVSNKPARGLIFGPTKGEEVIATSGKRLRVETESVGRPGGVYGSERDVQLAQGASSLTEVQIANPTQLQVEMGSETAIVLHESQTGEGAGGGTQ
ncbi:unnamed protein product [Arabidopsis halleri]